MSDFDNEERGSVYSYSYSEIHQGDADFSDRASGNQHSDTGDGGTWSPYEEPKKRRPLPPFGKKLLKVIAVALVFGLVAGAAFQGSSLLLQKALGAEEESKALTQLSSGGTGIDNTSTSSAITVTDVSDIVENVMPAVVAVTNVSISQYHSFFGRFSYEDESFGSGIIINQDKDHLYIATNNHVVSGAETLTITFANDTAVSATIKGTDPAIDLAVVEVALSDIDTKTQESIKVATVGDSAAIRVGESSVVIGNALGYGQSVTTGVISALDREVQLQDEQGNILKNRLIQTDAAVNPGNSGGALLNMNGEVIGIVSAKYNDTAVEGMGYAIPISSVTSIIEGFINEQAKEANGAYFGIAGVDVTVALAAEYELPSGVYVAQVVSGSGAAKAGIEKEDVITSFNGRKISSMEEIQNMLKYIPAGTTVEVTVARANDDYQEKTLEVTLGKKL